MSEITEMLKAMGRGEAGAGKELLPRVYEELRKMAAVRMAGQGADHTLQPTALVHEAYIKLLGNGERSWQDRRHFFAVAAEAMRQILVDRARKKSAVRRGGGRQKVDLDKVVVATETADETVLALNEAMEKLAGVDQATAELVKMRFFGGMTFEQAAETLGLSERTAKRMWAFARAWLYREIKAG